MYVITVIPIQKSFQKENLTYFSASEIAIGNIVSVPVRKQVIDAFVIDCENAQDLKSQLKGADFQLKKIVDVKGASPFSTNFLESCVKLRDYNVSNTGTIIKSLIPQIYLENIAQLQKFVKKTNPSSILPLSGQEVKENIKQEKLIFQNTLTDRIGFYRTLIREEFARRQSVYVCVPTSYDIENFNQVLSRGIESYVYTFDSGTNNKKLLDNFDKVTNEQHPILIIGTTPFLCIKRDDIKTIIIERESSSSFRQIARPYIDNRIFIEAYASLKNIKLMFADTILRPETLYRHEQNELGEVSVPLYHLPKKEIEVLVDMKQEGQGQDKKSFNILSEKTKKIISYAIKNKQTVLLYTNRKGIAPCTVCHDCGTTLLCPYCQLPIVLYNKKIKNAKTNKEEIVRVFMCNKCGRKDTTETRCGTCDSWNLVPLGIGIDRVYSEVTELYPEADITVIDKEGSTDKQARDKINKFKKVGGILIGTEMVFSYLQDDVDHSIIISLDGLLSIPSYNMTQKILHTIENIHTRTKTTVILQTRSFDNPILQHIFSGNILELSRSDKEERRDFGYPPYKRLVKISFTGNRVETEEVRNYLNDHFKNYEPQTFSVLKDKINSRYLTNTILKIDTKVWPQPYTNKIIDETLLDKLRSLPFTFSVQIDPEDVL